MLSFEQFEVLNSIYKLKQKCTEMEISKSTKISLEKINLILKNLKENKFIDEKFNITEIGFEIMKPYKVDNAIIMAAGTSSRFAPLSYEQPKGLLIVKGEKLIEREIIQLKDVGINDITLVVGYMKEKMLYLREKFGVNIVENNDYNKFNNTSSLILVTDKLKNTFICSSDNYFTENPFETYVYRAYYSAVYSKGETDEYCIDTDDTNRIKSVKIGGNDSWYMLGHVFFDKNFSEKFTKILKSEYEKQIVNENLWENLYINHIEELDMYIRKYEQEEIKEFDSLDELRLFDEKYIFDSGSKIFRDICKFLNCKENEITNIKPIKKDLKKSFEFKVFGESYIYTHPDTENEKYLLEKI